MYSKERVIWWLWFSGGSLVVFVIALVYFLEALLKRSAPYKMAVDYVTSHSQVQVTLGPPIETGWWILGKLTLQGGGGGRASFTFSMKGSQNKALVFLEAWRSDYKWTVYKLNLRIRPTGEILRLV